MHTTARRITWANYSYSVMSNCIFSINGKCSLNRYGGKPSDGVCAGCISRGENNAAFIPPVIPQETSKHLFLGGATDHEKDAVGLTPCVHLGELLRLEPCKSCGGNVQAKIQECAVHGECSRFLQPVGVKQCPCESYERATA